MGATPSFFDLRAWAARPPVLGRQPGQNWRHGRMTMPQDESAISIEAFCLARGSGAVAGESADEFLHVLDGELTVASNGTSISLEPGQSVVLPAGAPFEWRCGRPARLLAMRHADQPVRAPVCIMDPGLPRAPSAAPLAELLTTPTPACRNSTQFRSADETFTCGVWESSPYARKAMVYGHYELMHLLEGQVNLEDEGGARGAFSAGDVVLVRRGARCSWDSLTSVTKVFAIWRPV